MRFAPVILAGGSGTRFWPRSRRARAKQVLALDGETTMIQQTLARLLPVAKAEDVWVVTNGWLDEMIAEQLPTVAAEHILSEPVARNTAPACALTAFLLEKDEPETVIGVFPSDHVVANPERFAEVIAAGVRLAAAGENIVVLGVPPTRPETGYGYIEQGAAVARECGRRSQVHRVKRFREKPDRHTAERFLAAGNFAWNGGIFLWSARTLANAIREHVPDMAPLLETIAAAYGTPEFEEVFARGVSAVREHLAWTMRCWSGGRRRARRGRTSTACRRTSGGTTWARGRRCMSIWASMTTTNVMDGATTGLVTIECGGQLCVCAGKDGGAAGGGWAGGGGDGRCAADYDAGRGRRM